MLLHDCYHLHVQEFLQLIMMLRMCSYKEILKMVQFDHPNVMPLIGVCIESSNQNKLAMVLDQLRQHYDEIVMTDQDDGTVSSLHIAG